MARTPVIPVPAPVAPPDEVVVDYELALSTAQQFVRFFQGAQHLQRLVTLLTSREQIVQELDRRRMLAESSLTQVEEQIVAAKALYAAEQERMQRQTTEHTQRDADMQAALAALEARSLALEAAVAEQERAQAKARKDMEALSVQHAARMEAETDQLLARRTAEVHAIEQQHLAQLERLQAQSEAEAKRAEDFKADIAALRQRLVASVTEEGR